MHTTRLMKLLILPALLLLAGCSGDDGDGAPNLTQAWSDFRQQNWQASAEAFLEAIEADPDAAEAWCGLGWSRAALHASGGGGGDLRESVLGAFQKADHLRPDYVDAWAGLAEFHGAVGDTLAALNWSLDAADQGGVSYVFAHRSAVNHRSLRKIAAWNLFKMGRYPEAGAQVRHVLPEFHYAGQADSLVLLLEGIGSL